MLSNREYARVSYVGAGVCVSVKARNVGELVVNNLSVGGSVVQLQGLAALSVDDNTSASFTIRDTITQGAKVQDLKLR